MQILKIFADNTLTQVMDALEAGEVVVLPTETCYGLSCDATNKQAVEKIFQIKGRDEKKPLSVMFFDLTAAEEYVEFNDKAIDLVAEYWPGPLTLVLPRKNVAVKNLAPLYGVPEKTLGVRMPDHRFCLKLLFQFNEPLITTSANLSGAANPYSVAEIVQQFENSKYQPALIVDAGELPQTPPSTVVDLTGKDMKVLREGSIKVASAK